MDKELFDSIARVIGYHFWRPESDQGAINCGADCARDIIKALPTLTIIPHDNLREGKEG